MPTLIDVQLSLIRNDEVIKSMVGIQLPRLMVGLSDIYISIVSISKQRTVGLAVTV